MGTKQIEAFKLQTRIEVDNAKASTALKTTEKDVDKLGQRFTKLGPEITKAMKGTEQGARFGKDFGSSAVSSITSEIGSMGQTLGGLIGTAIAPGIGTAIGGTVGSAVDATIGKVSGPIMATIQKGIELNKLIEQTTIEFTTFAGSEKEAAKYLADIKKLAIDTGKDFGFLIDTSEHVYDLTNNLKLTKTILRAATDQAADFGGKAETIANVAEQLGLIAEKGELASRELNKLFKLGIDAKKYLAQATGLTEKNIERMIAQGRIRGDVAARLIAEGIERDKGGYAAKQALTSVTGAEQRFQTLSVIRAAEGTEKATQGIGDFYRQANQVLSSDQAQKFVAFIDKTTGSLINLVERGLRSGLNLATGLANGIESGESITKVTGAVKNIGSAAISSLEDLWEMHSPSKRFQRSGTDAVEGLALGIESEESRARLRASLENLLNDPRIKAMLDTISFSEGAGYNTMVGGGRISDLSKHPNRVVKLRGGLKSSAAGRYQFLSRTYGDESKRIGLQDFSPHSQDLAAVDQLVRSGAAARLLINDVSGAINAARKVWASFPGAGYGQGERSMSSLTKVFAQSLAVGGSAVSATNPVPVAIVNNTPDRYASYGNYYGAYGRGKKTQYSVGVSFDPNSLTIADGVKAVLPEVHDFKMSMDDLLAPLRETAASANLFSGAMGQFTAVSMEELGGLPPLAAGIAAFGNTARTEFALTNEVMKQNQAELIKSISITQQLSGMIAQASGFLPQQQVGKKRGLFSKILGFAAPFLSFIPGVGPILSQIAGIASNAVGGNWAGVATGVAGGFQPGGVFTSTHSGGGTGTTRPRTVGHRAGGGPVSAGNSYLVGELRPEIFTPREDGWIHPNANSAGGGGGSAALLDVISRLHATIDRLSAVSPGHVLAQGARENPAAIGHGLTAAYNRDAGLLRTHGRLHRFN